MRQIKIYDDQFPHAFTMANGGLNIKAKSFEWSRTLEGSKFAFITESWFNRVHLVKEPIKIGLLIEPKSFVPHWYEWIKHNSNLFSYVLTHDKKLIESQGNFLYYPYGGSWLYPNEQKTYKKTKNISIIASHKNDLPGHKMRHEVIRRLGSKVDVYGNGYKKVDSVLEAYKDYRFTISIENDKYDYWMTEKLFNPMLCGTIPFYWGFPSIHSFGLSAITFNDIESLVSKLEDFNYEQEYKTREHIVQNNFWEAKKYEITEDWIWENWFKHSTLTPLINPL